MFVSEGTVNVVYPQAVASVLRYGKRVASRVSDTQELHPATLVIDKPWRRLVTSHGRVVNPAFALAEVLWIFGARSDVEFLQPYNSKIGQYSDDGHGFNAAYGDRLRRASGFDQLEDVIQTLRRDPASRQAVLNVWHPSLDRGNRPNPVALGGDTGVIEFSSVPHETKDRACNVLGHLLIREGKLDWMQILRSNDIMWGTPNNFMQWLHLMEYVAARCEVPMGKYYHVADSLHLYDYHRGEAQQISAFDLYKELGVKRHTPMVAVDEAIGWAAAAVSALPRLSFRNSHAYAGIVAEAEERCGSYWTDVIRICAAHTCYRTNDDDMAAEILMSVSDRVLAAAQARYFWAWRWRKDAGEGRTYPGLAYLNSAFPKASVVQWIIDSVSVAPATNK